MAAGGHFGFWLLTNSAAIFARVMGAKFFLNTSKNSNQVSNLTMLSVVTGPPHCTQLYMRQITNHHWFRRWLVAWSAPSHYLNQCWNIVDSTLGNKLQWNFNRNSNIFIQENAFKNVVCELASICLGLNVLTSVRSNLCEKPLDISDGSSSLMVLVILLKSYWGITVLEKWITLMLVEDT